VHGRSRLASGAVVAVSKDDGVRGLVKRDDLKAPFGEFDYHFENPVDKSNIQVLPALKCPVASSLTHLC
jgi:hypothetical protein